VTLPAWHAHPDVWLLFGSIAAAFVVACRRHAERTGDETSARSKRLFLGGVALLWVASDWPVHDLSERYLYSVHMVQHLTFTLVAAPLLVAGTPAWMLRKVLAWRPAMRVFRFMTRPLVALIVFNGVLLFTHWPAVVDAAVGSEWTHFGLHVLIVASGLVMWWPIVSPLPELPPLSPPGQMVYLFIQSLAPTIPASFLTFGHTPLYKAYEAFPRIWGIDVLTDQLIAGLLMKIIGGAILWGVIASVFFRWGSRERRDGWDALQWRNVDGEIRAKVTR
jgi:putative membrane protein